MYKRYCLIRINKKGSWKSILATFPRKLNDFSAIEPTSLKRITYFGGPFQPETLKVIKLAWEKIPLDQISSMHYRLRDMTA
jgi:hypothetical protein